MYKAHLYHAVPITTAGRAAHPSVYHGLNKLFLVDRETPKYHGPFSTTLGIHVANRFANGEGLLFTILGSYANPFKRCVGIAVDWISCFGNEQEVLLFDQ